jgi:hypothetical protein
MNVKKLVVAWLVIGVVANVLDYLVTAGLFAAQFRQVPIIRQDTPVALWILFDFVLALVFVVVYDRLYAGGGSGVGRGVAFGFWTGLLMNFPMNIGLYLMFTGIPYRLTWVMTFYGIIVFTIFGAIAGALYRRKA